MLICPLSMCEVIMFLFLSKVAYNNNTKRADWISIRWYDMF